MFRFKSFVHTVLFSTIIIVTSALSKPVDNSLSLQIMNHVPSEIYWNISDVNHFTMRPWAWPLPAIPAITYQFIFNHAGKESYKIVFQDKQDGGNYCSVTFDQSGITYIGNVGLVCFPSQDPNSPFKIGLYSEQKKVFVKNVQRS